MGAKSFRSVKKTVVLITFWKVMSAAARTAFRLEKTWGGLGFDGVAGQDAGFRNQTDLTGGVQGVASQDSVRVGAESGGGVGRGDDSSHGDAPF